MKNKKLQNLTLSAMFLAIGLILPFFTGQIPQIGSMLLPMHIPVLLCGLICGPVSGLTVGLLLPLMRSFLFGMPPLFPVAIAMSFELATYGFMSGLLYTRSRWKCMISLYRSLLIAMLAGRVVWAIMEIILLGLSGGAFTLEMFVAGAFLNATPGIILQLVLIPFIMFALNKTGLVPFSNNKKAKEKANRNEQ